MNNNNSSNLSFDSSDIGGPIRKSTSTISLASSAYMGSWFILDVAGKEFRALKTALTREPSSYLARIVEDDVDTEQLAMDSAGLIVFLPDAGSGRWQLDSNADYFEYILKYLRTGKFNGVKPEHSLEDLLDEAEIFKLTKLCEICRQKIYERNMQQRTFLTSTSPSEASLFGGSSLGPTPSSSSHHLHHQQQFGPPPQLFYPPGFPLTPNLAQPPPLYSQPPPGFERHNIINSIPPQQQHSQQQRLNSSFGGGVGGISTQLSQESVKEQIQVAVSSSISNTSIGTLIDDNINIQQQILTNVTNRTTTNGSGGGLPRLDELPLDEEQVKGLSSFDLNKNKVEQNNTMNEQEEEENDQIFSKSLENNEKTNNDIGLPPTPQTLNNNATLPHNFTTSNFVWDDVEQLEDEIQVTNNVQTKPTIQPKIPENVKINDEHQQYNLNEFNECGINSTVFEPPIQPTSENDELDNALKFKKIRVPAFELSFDCRVSNYAKVLPIRKRYTQEFLDYLIQSDKIIENDYFIKFGVELGCVILYLQKLAFIYPNGCNIQQYADYEFIMKNQRQSENNQFFNNTVPSVVSLLQAGDLLKLDDHGKIFVSEKVCRVHLLCLRQNLCSNLFRFLLRRKHLKYRASVEVLLEEMKKMIPSSVESVPDVRCLISICNRFPAVFDLICKEEDNFDFIHAYVCLNEQIVKKNSNIYWRVVLDCECANMNWDNLNNDENNDYGSSFCDCENCQSMEIKFKENYFGLRGQNVVA